MQGYQQYMKMESYLTSYPQTHHSPVVFSLDSKKDVLNHVFFFWTKAEIYSSADSSPK